ncbi:MAG: MOSC domain-containing protein [Gemmatimonadota bacterium]
MPSPRVAAIHIAPDAGTLPQSVVSVRAVAGKGLEGDRYYQRIGTFSKKDRPAREVTLIEAEALEALAQDYGLELPPGATRRNITTEGVALNHLVGRTFQVGEATLRGIQLCEPCSHMERLTGREGVKRGLVHRGGLNAEVMTDGTIRVGDRIMVD